jgi:glycosyltransferase involved in cell wall biosynthesis
MAPILSAVVPVSNMAGRLRNLQSWICESNQSEIEVIIVHDKKDNATGIELANIVKGLNNVEIVETNCGNPGEARNLGMSLATGEWICFWDSDDIPIPSVTLEVIKSEMITSETDLIVFPYKYVDIPKKLEVTKNRVAIAGVDLNLEIALDPGIWRYVFRLEGVKATNFPPLMMGEDQVWLARIGIFEKKKVVTNLTNYSYIQGFGPQLTKSKVAIRDIPNASGLILETLMMSSVESKEYLSTLVIRQIITGVKRLPGFEKLRTVSTLVQLGKRVGLKLITRNFLKVISYQKKYALK